MADLVPKVLRSTVLNKLLGSFRASLGDPEDELVHLYEIVDALKVHFGREAAARNAFPGASTNMGIIGKLAKDPRIKQGRHRGRDPGPQRSATPQELDDARRAAFELIRGFAATLP